MIENGSRDDARRVHHIETYDPKRITEAEYRALTTRIIKEAGKNMSKCDLPPPGWECTRGAAHDGPCVAVPDNYTCNGRLHQYIGFDTTFGSYSCPGYPDCRSEAAVALALEEENEEPMDYCDGKTHSWSDDSYSQGQYPCPGWPKCRDEKAKEKFEQLKFTDNVDPYEGIDLKGLIPTKEELLNGPPLNYEILDRLREEHEKLKDILPSVDVPDFSPPPTSLAQTFQVLGDVAEERQKQEVKWGQQNHDDLMWSAILAEEVGESAQEVLTQVWGKESGGGHGDLRGELVQVAAVAVAWIEAIDRRG